MELLEVSSREVVVRLQDIFGDLSDKDTVLDLIESLQKLLSIKFQYKSGKERSKVSG